MTKVEFNRQIKIRGFDRSRLNRYKTDFVIVVRGRKADLNVHNYYRASFYRDRTFVRVLDRIDFHLKLEKKNSRADRPI